jgi:hypothetical protein
MANFLSLSNIRLVLLDFRIFDDEGPAAEAKAEASKPPTRGQHRKTRSQIVPTTDEEIESAGTAFLDVIGKSFGLR